MTAKAEKSDWRKGMNMGADDYLTKPFEEMELLTVVETRLKRSKSFKQSFPRTSEVNHYFINTAKGLDNLKALSKNKKSRVYKKKEKLFHEGDFADSIFLIARGKIRTYKTNNDAKELTIGLFKAGDFIGYTPLIQESEYTDSAVALEDSEIYRIHKDDFKLSLFKSKEVAHSFIKMLAGNLVEKEQELINLAYQSVRKRVADGLLLLQKKYQENSENIFSMAISRDDLASIVGTSTESVIRVLSDFKEEGLIKIKGSNIAIANKDGLARLKG